MPLELRGERCPDFRAQTISESADIAICCICLSAHSRKKNVAPAHFVLPYQLFLRVAVRVCQSRHQYSVYVLRPLLFQNPNAYYHQNGMARDPPTTSLMIKCGKWILQDHDDWLRRWRKLLEHGESTMMILVEDDDVFY